jgi:hypothetical protein
MFVVEGGLDSVVSGPLSISVPISLAQRQSMLSRHLIAQFDESHLCILNACKSAIARELLESHFALS